MRLVSGIVAAALLVCAATACSTGEAAAAQVFLEPAVDPGADPFTDSVQIGPVPTIAPVAMEAAAQVRGTFAVDAALGVPVAVGTDPELFGGSPGTQLCDTDQLVTLLSADADKAAAWGGALGVGSDDIAGYVAELTPVVLTSDTLVTNHTYRDGAVTDVQSVLEAGTAVLVAAVGVPRVKCNSGNPLTEPDPLDPDATTFDGDRWGGFDPDAVIAVEPGAAVDTFTLVDVGTGTPFDVPAGTGGPAPDLLAAPDFVNGTWTVSPEGLDDPACLGGATIVIDGTTATMSVPGRATISGTVDGGPSGNAAIAETFVHFADLELVLRLVRPPDLLLGRFTPGCDEFVTVRRVGSGTGTPAPQPSVAPPATADPSGWAAAFSAEDGSHVVTSADGAQWTEVSHLDFVYMTGLAYGAGTWVAVGYGQETSVALTSRDLLTWTQVTTFDVVGSDWVNLADVAYGDGRFLAVGNASVIDEGTHAAPLMYTSADGRAWTELTGFDTGVFEPVPADPAMDASGMQLVQVDHADGRFVIAGHSRVGPQTGWPEQAVAVYELADGSDQPAVVVPWRAVGDNETALAAAGDRALLAAVPGEPTANAAAVTASLELLIGTSTEAIAGTPLESTSTELLASGPDGFRAIVNGERDPATGIPQGPARFYSSADGVEWELLGSSSGNFKALAAGPITAAVPTTTAPTTVVAAPAPTSTLPPAPVTPALPTVCVRPNIDFAAVRAEPDLDGDLVAEVPPGSCDVGLIDTTEVQGGGIRWYHVRWQGIEGWTAASNTTRTVTPPPASPGSSPGGPPADWTVDTPAGAACPAPGAPLPDGWWAAFTDMSGGGTVELAGGPVRFGLRCDPQATLLTMERVPGAPVSCVNYGSAAPVACPAALQYMFLWVRMEGGDVAELVGAFVGG